MKPWGRFTLRGSPDVEMAITALMSQAAECAQAIWGQDRLHAMILTGEYGRGEGGVERIGSEERPAETLALLGVIRSFHEHGCESLTRQLEEKLQSLAVLYHIQLSVDFITPETILDVPCQTQWYDLRFGHKTICGDPQWISSMRCFSIEQIAPCDVRDSLVHWGMLSMANEQLLQMEDLSDNEKRLFVKNQMKTVIGYGDALLYFSGDYHWSMVEKQQRMRNRTDVDPAFQRVYEEAVEFGFQSNYDLFLKRDFRLWLEEWREQASAVHLRCESFRLSQSALTWKTYLEAAFRRSLWDKLSFPRSIVKVIRDGMRGDFYPARADWSVRWGYRCCGIRERLSLIFPAVAYRLEENECRELVRKVLHAESMKWNDLRTAFLRKWSIYGDENLPISISVE